MVRRRLTLKRIDPWSVLKFGFAVNVVLLVMFLLVAMVVWFIIDRLALVDQLCDIALDVGFTQCGINFGNLFRALALLGLLWVIVQSAVLVFFSFLHNLLADLTGGLAVTVNDITPGAAARGEVPARGPTGAGRSPTGGAPPGPPTTAPTGSPPVPPLQRDPQATAAIPPQDRPAPNPRAPDRDAPRRGGEAAGGDSGDVMFGERRDRPERPGPAQR